jgi:hypothetical protein
MSLRLLTRYSTVKFVPGASRLANPPGSFGIGVTGEQRKRAINLLRQHDARQLM